MFLLKSLPTKDQIAVFAKQFSELDPETVVTTVRLLKAASLITSRVETELAKHNLTQAKFIVLIILNRGPERQLRPVEIASAMGISKKNTSRLLNAMLEEDLIKLENHVTDKRSYVTEATPRGTTLLRKVLPHYYRILNSSMRSLAEKQKRDISKFMHLIIKDLE